MLALPQTMTETATANFLPALNQVGFLVVQMVAICLKCMAFYAFKTSPLSFIVFKERKALLDGEIVF